MIKDISTEAFIDGVVEYHQIRAELDLTLVEAKQHPDTLDTFDELVDNVATNPELRFAYTGVLKSRGQNRINATNSVREIEFKILGLSYDVGATSDRKYETARKTLKTDEGIKKRAQTFVNLFKSVIPADELPKRRRAPTTRVKQPAILSEEPLTEPTIEPVFTETPLRYFERLAAEKVQQGQDKQQEQRDQVQQRREMHAAVNLLSGIANTEQAMTAGDQVGVRWTELAKVAATKLYGDEPSEEEVEKTKAALRNFQHSGDLHVVGHDKGIRRLSTNQPADKVARNSGAQESIWSELNNKTDPKKWSEYDAKTSPLILDTLTEKLQHVEQGMAASDLERTLSISKVESDEFRRCLRKMKRNGLLIVESRRQTRNSGRSQPNSVMLIRLADQKTKLRWKNERETVIDELNTWVGALPQATTDNT